MLLGSVNHVSLTVSDLDQAMEFFGPFLRFLGYETGEVLEHEPARTRLTVNLNPENGTAANVWETRDGLGAHPSEVYEIGLHHVAFNVALREQVDELARLAPGWGATLLEGPGEYPYAPGGYYAVYLSGPDGLVLEVAHMPEAEARWRAMGGDGPRAAR